MGRPDPSTVQAVEDEPRHEVVMGTVTENKDPKDLGRVRVRVNHLSKEGSLDSWAWPICQPGGGGAQRGFWWIPEIGATVVVWFLMGDLTRPLWAPGPWAKPGGVSEVPTDAQGQADPSVKKIMETGKWQISLDDGGSGDLEIKRKGGSGKLVFKDDGTVVFDGTAIELSEGATEAVLKGDAFKVVYDLHAHVETGGTTGGPTVALPANTLSTKAKVGG